MTPVSCGREERRFSAFHPRTHPRSCVTLVVMPEDSVSPEPPDTVQEIGRGREPHEFIGPPEPLDRLLNELSQLHERIRLLEDPVELGYSSDARSTEADEGAVSGAAGLGESQHRVGAGRLSAIESWRQCAGGRNTAAADRLALQVREYLGAKEWAKAAARGPLQPGQNKCNLFVGEMLERAGMSAPKTRDGFYFSTEQWVGNRSTIRCWSETSIPRAGSVAVYRESGFGHVSIVTNPNGGLAVSAGKSDVGEYTHWSQDSAGVARHTSSVRDVARPDFTERAQVHFFDYRCPDHEPTELRYGRTSRDK